MREWERFGVGSRSSSSSVSSIEGAGILPSFRQREHPLHVQIFAVIAGFRGDQTGEIQLKALLNAFGIDVVSSLGDVQCELVCRTKDARQPSVELHIDAEPLAPLAVHL